MNENNTNATNQNNVAIPVQQSTVQPANVDYDKMAEALEKRSNGFMKSYLKEQGLSEDEMKEAIKTFKSNKTEKEEAVQNNLSNMQNQLQESLNQNKQLKIEKSAYQLTDDLGVDKKTMPYLIKMADFKDCFDEKGNISNDKVKESLNKVLEDIPGLKKQEENKTGIIIGADTSNSSQPSGNLFNFGFTGVRKH